MEDQEALGGWPALFADAGTRHGAFHLRRCADFGLSARTVRRRAIREAWDNPHRRVFCLPGSTDTWWRRMAAILEAVGPDAALGLLAAAHALGILFREPDLTDIVRVNGKHRPELPDVKVHNFRTLDESEMHLVNGLRVTTPQRTLRDLAGSLELPRLQAITIDAAFAGIAGAEMLLHEAARMQPGPARRALEHVARDLGRVRTDSPFAFEVLEGLAATGLQIEGEFPWRCPDGRIIHHDGAIADAWVAVECDGRGKYRSGNSFTTDRKRWTQTSGQWRTVWVDWQRWRQEPRAVIADVWRAVTEADPTRPPAVRFDCRCQRCRAWAEHARAVAALGR